MFLFFSVLGVNAQNKKKSTGQQKRTTPKNISIPNSLSKKIENSIFLKCDSNNEPIYEIVGMEQKKEYIFLTFYGTGKLVIFQGSNSDEAINKGPIGNGTWEVLDDKIAVDYWGNTSKYILKSDGNLSEDKYYGNSLRFLDKF